MMDMLRTILELPHALLAGPSGEMSVGIIAVTATAFAVAIVIGRVRARRRRQRELSRDRRLDELERALAHHREIEQTLRGLVLRQAESIDSVKSHHGKIKAYLLDLDARVSAQSSLGEAIDRVRRGASLEPLLRNRQLSSEEARLIRQIHNAPRGGAAAAT